MKTQLQNKKFVFVALLFYFIVFSTMMLYTSSPQKSDSLDKNINRPLDAFLFNSTADKINLSATHCNVRVEKSPDGKFHYDHNPEQYTFIINKSDDTLDIQVKKTENGDDELFDMVTFLIPDRAYDTITVNGDNAGIGLPYGIDANFSLINNNGAMAIGISEGFSKNIDFTCINGSGSLFFAEFATDYTLELNAKTSSVLIDLPKPAPKLTSNSHYVYIQGNGQSKITLNIESSAFSVGSE